MKPRHRMIPMLGIVLVILSLVSASLAYPADPADMDTSLTDPGALVRLGDELFFLSDYGGALEYYHEALVYIDTPEVLLRYAFALGETGQYDQSRAMFNEALDLDLPFRDTPKAFPGEERWDTEHWLERLGNPEEAIYHDTDALEEFPRSPIITYALAWAYSYLYNHERAIHYFKETVKNDPLFIDVYGSLGTTLSEHGEDPYAALHYLNISLLLNPTGSVAENIKQRRDDILLQLNH